MIAVKEEPNDSSAPTAQVPESPLISSISAPSEAREVRNDHVGQPQQLTDDDTEYEIVAILDRCQFPVVEGRRTSRKTHYLVRFKDYGPEYDEWVPFDRLSAPRLVRSFNKRRRRDAQHSSSGSESPQGTSPDERRRSRSRSPQTDIKPVVFELDKGIKVSISPAWSEFSAMSPQHPSTSESKGKSPTQDGLPSKSIENPSDEGCSE